MLQQIIDSKSKTFLAFCFSFLAGVAAASLLDWRPGTAMLYVLLFCLPFLMIIFWERKFSRFFLLFLLCFFIGIVRHAFAFPASNDISKLNGQTITLSGTVAKEPDVRTDGVRYVIQTQSEKGKAQNYIGRVYIKYSLYPRYEYGDEIQATCKLKAPQPFAGKDNPTGRIFRYDMYLALSDVFSICEDPKMIKIGEGGGSVVMKNILDLKGRVAGHVAELWPEPYASFMAGLLYGYRGGLGEDLTDAFNRTGVTHIIAISGYNISLIAWLFLTLCIRFWIPRQKAFWLVTAGIIVFVIFTGAGASVVRAGIMGFLTILATQLGRLRTFANVLALTAVLMVFHNPFTLIWDAGFQLSFLATIGLIYLAPIIESYLVKVPSLWRFKKIFIETSAAIIATLPLMLYQFGRVSLVASIVNLLVLPTIPFLMIAGAVAIALGGLLPFLSWPAFIGMKYVIVVVEWFARLPFTSFEVAFPWWGMVFLYGAIFRLLWKDRRRLTVHSV